MTYLLMIVVGCGMLILAALGAMVETEEATCSSSNLTEPSAADLRLDKLLRSHPLSQGDVVVLACVRGCGMCADFRNLKGLRMYPIPCGSVVQPQTVERLRMAGATGVLIASCSRTEEASPALKDLGPSVSCLSANRQDVTQVIEASIKLKLLAS